MMTPPDSRTTTDKKFEQAKKIYSIAKQFSDAIVVLHELCCAIGDQTSNCNSLLEKSAFVKKNHYPPYLGFYCHYYNSSKGFITGSRHSVCSSPQRMQADSGYSKLTPGKELIVQSSERQIPHLAKFVVSLDPIYCCFEQLFVQFWQFICVY